MAGIFGSIDNPLNTIGGGNSYGDVNPGLPNFISNIVKLLLIAGGLFTLFTAIFAGYTYMTANGDKGKLESAISSINMSILGLVVMVAAVTITGIISWILFGNAGAILQPTIYGPGTI